MQNTTNVVKMNAITGKIISTRAVQYDIKEAMILPFNEGHQHSAMLGLLDRKGHVRSRF